MIKINQIPQRLSNLLLWAGCLAIVFPVNVAQAAFHLWSVDEVYSSADGSVQFVKLTTTATGQSLLSGQSITCTGPGGTHRFTFPANLPSSTTANKTFLIGTSNLALIPGGVTPDYVFTNAVPFLFQNGGVTNMVGIIGSAETPAAYTNLPADGEFSLSGGGSSLAVTTNAPKNFSGQSNSIVPVQFLSTEFDQANCIVTFRTATGVNASPGPNYAVQFNDDLTNQSWTVLTNLTGDGATHSVSNDVSVSEQRFFRLRVP